ncbi:MAG: hypothetical protein WC758_02880 [Candidatus Woesearchaeota archaeon]|jgi:hypothetical protein
MNLSKEEFSVLWNVEHSWEDNPNYASDDTTDSIKKFQNIFLKLEEARLIDIHIVNNKIHDAILTPLGLATLKNSDYSEWADELKEKLN